ncbi:MAG: hypothetical protein AVDCRST_MAG85-3832, partial [uncultured Solirubrobacteraceae bacterium]
AQGDGRGVRCGFVRSARRFGGGRRSGPAVDPAELPRVERAAAHRQRAELRRGV